MLDGAVEREEGGQIDDIPEAGHVSSAAQAADMAGHRPRGRRGEEDREDVGQHQAERGLSRQGGHDQLLLVVGTEAQEVLIAQRLLAGVEANAC